MYITPYISKLEINVLGYISVLSFLHSADSNTSTLNDRNYTDSGAGHLYMALSATLKKKEGWRYTPTSWKKPVHKTGQTFGKQNKRASTEFPYAFSSTASHSATFSLFTTHLRIPF